MFENLLNNSSEPLFVERWFFSFFCLSGFAILTLVAILTILFEYLRSVKEMVVCIANQWRSEKFYGEGNIISIFFEAYFISEEQI